MRENKHKIEKLFMALLLLVIFVPTVTFFSAQKTKAEDMLEEEQDPINLHILCI